jgi:para-nitrobenzyl esterase
MFRGTDTTLAAAVGRTYRRAVAAFVRTGNPHTAGVPLWPCYTLDERSTMRFDVLTGPAVDPAGPERRLAA